MWTIQRDNRISSARLALAVAILVGAPGVRGVGQADDARISIEEFAAKRFRRGDRATIAGRYSELRGHEIAIEHLSANLVLPTDELRRKVLELETIHETLLFDVECVEPSRDRPHFQIVAVRPGPALETLLREDLKRLESGRSSADLLHLAARIVKIAREREDAGFSKFARDVCARYLSRRESELARNNVGARLADVREIQKLLEDRAWAMEHLAKLEERFPRADEIRAELIALGCRKFRGTWMTYEDFKRLQGFEEHRGRWLTRQEKDFVLSVEWWLRDERADLILRNRLDREYDLLAANGKTALGMNAEEVAQAIGFPDRVYRRLIQGRTFTQWVYDDRYLYFVDGQLFRAPEERAEIR